VSTNGAGLSSESGLRAEGEAVTQRKVWNFVDFVWETQSGAWNL